MANFVCEKCGSIFDETQADCPKCHYPYLILAAQMNRLDATIRRTEASSTMNIEELRKLTRNGFRPFKLHLSDGRSFNVAHPEFIAFSELVVVVFGADRLPNLIAPWHIVSAKPMKTKPAK